MARKVTYNIVKESFDSAGYLLLSKEYKNAYAKLKYVCPNKHEHYICWHDWQQGARCVYCAGIAKPDFGYIKSSFEKDNYVLLSEEYVNNKKPLRYKCPNGTISHISWANWKTDSRCPCYSCRREIHLLQGIKQSGSNHWNWRGGISNSQYCSEGTTDLKDFIKDRDAKKCLNPYCVSSNSDDLTVHHIDYDKKNCDLASLITICRLCNAKANQDRKWHKSWYQAILKNRYYRGAQI